ncbi:MAG: hypothetical protein JNM22_14940 [Saprospiraceae bacterium]|nr:hypothetical protein [Saprospiraceae bacterium]
MRITLITSLLFCCFLTLSAQKQELPRLRNQAVSLQGIIMFSPAEREDGVGLVSLNYERAFFSFPSKRMRIGAVAGLTPPLADDIDFAFHLGPKLYMGGPTSWFCADIQYWGLFNTSNATTSFDKIVTLGLGYCYTGPRGFFFNPEVLMGGRTPDRSHLIFGESGRSVAYVGASLGFGYCF